jgi:hypothetical protein
LPERARPKEKTMRALLIVLAVAALATAAYGQETFVWFYGAGIGDFMASPVVFGGAMDPGGDITDGSWSITIPDDTWPTDPAARQQYIWDTYFAPNYSAGNPSFWTGYFDEAHGDSLLNPLSIVNNAPAPDGGSMSGVCSVQMQVQDLNNNGVLDGEGEFEEFCSGSLSGLVIIIRNGEGAYDGLCGTGNYFGSYEGCFGLPQSWNYGMYLWLEDCTTPVEDATWGAIKALYQ